MLSILKDYLKQLTVCLDGTIMRCTE
jgi:hypothetical protein